MEALEVGDIQLTADEVRSLEQHKEWVGQVYAALGDEEEIEDDASVIARAIDKVKADESREIGEAFSELIYQLEEEYSDWSRWFDILPTVMRTLIFSSSMMPPSKPAGPIRQSYLSTA